MFYLSLLFANPGSKSAGTLTDHRTVRIRRIYSSFVVLHLLIICQTQLVLVLKCGNCDHPGHVLIVIKRKHVLRMRII